MFTKINVIKGDFILRQKSSPANLNVGGKPLKNGNRFIRPFLLNNIVLVNMDNMERNVCNEFEEIR